jgi:hypothetical protein
LLLLLNLLFRREWPALVVLVVVLAVGSVQAQATFSEKSGRLGGNHSGDGADRCNRGPVRVAGDAGRAVRGICVQHPAGDVHSTRVVRRFDAVGALAALAVYGLFASFGGRWPVTAEL